MRIALTLSLLLAAAPVLADWVKVARTDAAVHYVDPVTVHDEGGLRRAWVMQDMVETGPERMRSLRALQEYDCAGERFRYLALVAYDKPMASGEVLAAYGLSDTWNERPRGSRPSSIELVVCGF